MDVFPIKSYLFYVTQKHTSVLFVVVTRLYLVKLLTELLRHYVTFNKGCLHALTHICLPFDVAGFHLKVPLDCSLKDFKLFKHRKPLHTRYKLIHRFTDLVFVRNAADIYLNVVFSYQRLRSVVKFLNVQGIRSQLSSC
jgi:hypothetical protein